MTNPTANPALAPVRALRRDASPAPPRGAVSADRLGASEGSYRCARCGFLHSVPGCILDWGLGPSVRDK